MIPTDGSGCRSADAHSAPAATQAQDGSAAGYVVEREGHLRDDCRVTVVLPPTIRPSRTSQPNRRGPEGHPPLQHRAHLGIGRSRTVVGVGNRHEVIWHPHPASRRRPQTALRHGCRRRSGRWRPNTKLHSVRLGHRAPQPAQNVETGPAHPARWSPTRAPLIRHRAAGRSCDLP